MKEEFSKIAVLIGFAIEAFVTVFTCAMVWRMGDLSGLVYVAATSGSTILATVSFYFWKAKAENKSRTAKAFVKAIAETYGVDAAIQILEIVVRE